MPYGATISTQLTAKNSKEKERDKVIAVGRHPTGERKYEITHIWDVHREIIRRLVLGEKPGDIAEALHVSRQTVSNVQNSSLAKQEIARLRGERDESVKEIQEQLKELAPRAVQVLQEVMDDPVAKPNERLNAAKDVLDRAGYGAVKKVAAMHAHLTPEDIESFKERGLEIAQSLVVSNVE